GRGVEGGAGVEVGEELPPALADGLGVLEVLRVEVLDVPGVEAEGVLLEAVLAHDEEGGWGEAKVTPARGHRFPKIRTIRPSSEPAVRAVPRDGLAHPLLDPDLGRVPERR